MVMLIWQACPVKALCLLLPAVVTKGLCRRPSGSVLTATLYSYESFSEFGGSVGFAGDVNGNGYSDIIIGAPKMDNGMLLNAGAVFLYEGAGLNDFSIPSSTFGIYAESHLGTDVSGLGDFNGDGYGDFAIGVPDYGFGGESEGRVLIYTGNQDFSFSSMYLTSSIIPVLKALVLALPLALPAM